MKIGDIVKALKSYPDYNIVQGGIYTITSIHNNGYGIYIRVNNNKTGNSEASFELLDENNVEQISTFEPDYLNITKSICSS